LSSQLNPDFAPLPCPNCNYPVEQSTCGGCRQKIHFYVCPKCGGKVENPVYLGKH
jgi:predicted RNA-binding Zn-ribbon protein involved in translation (DUF1610 family)